MTSTGDILAEPVWQRPAGSAAPAGHDCDLWRVALDEVPGVDSALSGAGPLDAAERARAGAFVFEQDRRRFVASRIALRRILGSALGIEPAAVPIEAPPLARPRLASGRGGLDFNLSHSGGVALLAVGRSGPLGVDVEELRAVPDAEALASRLFTEAEQQELRASDSERRTQQFLVCWTRKEAVLKSTGSGLSVEPRLVGVGTGPGPCELVFAAPGGAVRLRVESFAAGRGAVGACALPPRMRVTRWLDGPPD